MSSSPAQFKQGAIRPQSDPGRTNTHWRRPPPMGAVPTEIANEARQDETGWLGGHDGHSYPARVFLRRILGATFPPACRNKEISGRQAPLGGGRRQGVLCRLRSPTKPAKKTWAGRAATMLSPVLQGYLVGNASDIALASVSFLVGVLCTPIPTRSVAEGPLRLASIRQFLANFPQKKLPDRFAVGSKQNLA